MKNLKSKALLAALVSTVAAMAQGPDAFGYRVTDRTPYSFVDIASTGVSVLAGADDRTASLNPGFTFVFYGTGYTSVCVSDNGLIALGGCDAEFNNIDFTSQTPAANRPLIAPFWDDLSFAWPGSGSVVYQTLGAPGSRRFIIQWDRVSGSNGTGLYDFQVILSEADRSIRFQYRVVSSGDPAQARGAGATVGIRGIGGNTNGNRLQWSFNAPVLSDNLALLFTAPAAPPPSGGGPIIPPQFVETISVSPDTVSWICSAGSSTGLSQALNVQTNQSTTFTARPQESWLVLDRTTGNAPGPFTLAIKDCKLPVGEYSSNVAFTTAAGTAANVQVKLSVTAPPELFTTPPQLTFRRRAGDPVPADQTMWVVARVRNTDFTLSTESPWLEIVTSKFQTPRQMTVKLKNPPSTVGVYTGTILATSSDASNSPLRIPVSYEVTLGAAAFSGNITNGASFAAGAVAPGSFATLFGTGFSAKRGLAAALPLPTELEGVSLRINGALCPLFMVDPEQLNFQIPFELTPGEAKLEMFRGTTKVTEIVFDLLPVAPGLAMNGKWAAALNQNGTVNGSQQAAPASSIVALYATGQGAVNGPVRSGEGAAGPPWREPTRPVTATVGGRPARVFFAALAPGLVGAMQVNVEIPAGLPAGEHAVEISVGGISSNTGLLLVGPAQ